MKNKTPKLLLHLEDYLNQEPARSAVQAQIVWYLEDDIELMRG